MSKRRMRRINTPLIVMIVGAALMVYPYAYMTGQSFKTRLEFAKDRTGLVPPRFQIDERLRHMRGEESAVNWPGADWPLFHNYIDAVRIGRIDRYLANSFIYASLVTLVQLSTSLLAAYAFARMTFRGRDFLFLLLLSTMMIPPTVLLIPNFLVLKELGLVDTVWGVLLPGFAGAFGVFLLRQWMLNLPSELEHAARIDGCSTWGILRHVILPLSKPALITLGIFTFMGAWNAFEWPLVVLSNQDYYPLTVGLSLFQSDSYVDWPRIFAASAMGSVPLIAMFVIAQRYLVGGISLSGMKA